VAATGLPVAVAESPDAPPRDHRPHRLLAKQRAGAQIAFLNHVADAASLAAFASSLRALGVTLPLEAGVAVYTDERSARILQAFPGLQLDNRTVERVLSAPDPVAAGIDAAVAEARALLAVEGVVGVNLSGLASSRGEAHGAQVKAAVGHALHEVAA
jgi:5,10-methylenetetrahydrofolate reductase